MCNPTPRVATEIQQGGESQPTLFPALFVPPQRIDILPPSAAHFGMSTNMKEVNATNLRMPINMEPPSAADFGMSINIEEVNVADFGMPINLEEVNAACFPM